VIRLAPALLLLACAAPAQDDPNWTVPRAMAARAPAGRGAAAAESGASAASEAAVEAGLKWLATQQKRDGSWEFDPRDPKMKVNDPATATGMALLPFLGAGHTPADGKYKKTVADGLAWLKNDLNPATGKFARGSPQYMYGHGIATLALCEAYALTGDAALKAPAQAAVNYVVKAQGANGSWGYQAGTTGDTSITGWQLQALFAAQQGKLTVPDATVKTAVKFLDQVAVGPNKAAYGYANATGKAGTSLTAVGLWCRYHFDGWNPNHAGFQEGVAGLADPAKRPKTAAQVKQSPVAPEMYFGYYATQVMHRAGGEAWADWFQGPREGARRVGGMREWLTAVQYKEGVPAGSWNPDSGTIGLHCGRTGSTALALLTLETPYRYLPLYRARP
jgi:hypothetical protein